MTTNHKDPKSYVDFLVTKRGKSGPEGVYLTNVTVVAEAGTDYGYKVNFSKCSPSCPPQGVEYVEWLDLLVHLREDNPQIPQSIHFNDGIYQFISEGGSMSLNAFLPYLDSQELEYFVTSSQDALNYVAKFSGKIPAHVRFSVGFVNKKWEDMAEDGDVEGMDLNY